MTSPGGSSGITAPDDSVSSTGASALASNTQTNVVNRKKAEVKASSGWNSASDTLFGTLFGGFVQGITGFISFLVFALKGVTGGLIDLTGSLKATDTKAENAQNTANNAQNTATGAVQQVAQVTQKIIAFDVKSPRPGWESINPTEFASIPRALLFMGVRVSGSGTYFRDDEPDTDLKGSTPFVAATQFYVFIRVPVDGELTGLNFYARGTPTALHARVHPMSPSGDLLDALTPESPSLHADVISTRHSSVQWVFPSPLIVESGTWIAVGFRCVGTVALAAQELFDPAPPEGFFPVKLSATTNRASGVALPATVAQSALSWTTGTVPYVAIGSLLLAVPNKRNLSDNFDRPDTSSFPGSIGPSWSYRSTRGAFDASGLYLRSNAVAWSGGDNGTAEIAWTTPLTTESVISYVHVGTPQPVAWSTFFICGNSTGTSGLTVGYRSDGIGLWKKTGVALRDVDIIIPAVARTLALGDTVELQEGETVDDVFYPDTVLVRHNGVEIIRTTVTAATVPRGKGFRYCGCGVARTPFQNSTPVLDWQAFDVPEVEPAA